MFLSQLITMTLKILSIDLANLQPQSLLIFYLQTEQVNTHKKKSELNVQQYPQKLIQEQQLSLPLVKYNMIKQDQSSKKSKINTSRQISSAASKRVDSNYMMNEMKQLLKENTALKQENLLLKQQIMLSKIQIQNLTLKLQQTLTNTPQTFTLTTTNTEANTKEFSKKHVGRHTKLRSELYKQKFLQNERKSKEEDTLKMFKQEVLKQISQYSTLGNTIDESLFQDRKAECMSSRSTIIRRDEQMQNHGKNLKIQREGKSLSRKQQIMNKYRPFLDICSSRLAQKIEAIRSQR